MTTDTNNTERIAALEEVVDAILVKVNALVDAAAHVARTATELSQRGQADRTKQETPTPV